MSATGHLQSVARETLRLSRPQLDPRRALRCTIGVLAPLLIGIVSGSLADGVAAAVGALCTGFATYEGSYRTRATIGTLAAVGMGVSTLVGALAAASTPATIVVEAAWGFLAGMLVSLGPAAIVVGLQWAVAAIIVSAIPMTTDQALVRAALVVAGGAFQVVLVMLLWPVRTYPAERQALQGVYQALAHYARRVTEGSLVATRPTAIDDAAKVLADPQPFGRSVRLQSFQALLTEAERIQTSIASVAWVRARLDQERRQRLDTVLRSAGDGLDGIATALAGDRGRVVAAVAGAPLGEAAGAGLEWPEMPAPHDDVGSVGRVERDLQRTVDHLEGQLRSAARTVSLLAMQPQTPSEEAAAGGARPPLSRQRWSPWREGALAELRSSFSWNSATFRHAVRLAATLAAAAVIGRVGGLAHAYWIPLTALVVLRADYIQTAVRGVSRIIGTLIGAALATAISAWLDPGTAGLTVLFTAAVLLSYLLVRANYLLFSIFVTSYIVFLLAFVDEPATATVDARLVATLIGGGLALAVYLVWPTWEQTQVSTQLGKLLAAQRGYVRAVLASYCDPAASDHKQLSRLRSGARLARMNAEASLSRLESEPELHREDGLHPEVARPVLAASYNLVLSVLSLHGRLGADDSETMPPLAPFSEAVDEELGRLIELLGADRRQHGFLSSRTAAPPTASAFVELRRAHNELCRAISLEPGVAASDRVTAVLTETDYLVDSIDTIEHVLAGDSAPR